MRVDFAFVPYHSLESDHPDLVPIVRNDDIDSRAWEQVICSMPQAYVEIIICLYLGLTPKEISKVLHYGSVSSFYTNNRRMKQLYREQKSHHLAYN